LARNRVVQGGKTLKVFDVEFTDIQRQVLALLGVSERLFIA